MTVKTDTRKALEALQNAGTTGVHSFDLNHIIGTTRAAARIQDLKDEGYSITSTREKKGNAWGVRYVLTQSPVTVKRIVKYEFIGNTAYPVYT